MSDTKTNVEFFKENLEELKNMPKGEIFYSDFPQRKKEGFFSSFSIGKSKKNTEFVLTKGDYISLKGFCIYLKNYLNFLDKSNMNIYKKMKEYDPYIDDFNMCYENNVLDILWGDGYMIHNLKIDISEFPRVIEDKKDVYMSIKEEIYNYISALQTYNKVLEIIDRDIVLSEKVTLKIEPFKLTDKVVDIKIFFGNIALYEIHVNNNNDTPFKIFTYSKDYKVDCYIKEIKDNLFEEIFINENKISELLGIFHTIGNIVF